MNTLKELTVDKGYYFADKNAIGAFMANEKIWGEDLTKYSGFYDTVRVNVEKIEKGVCLL